MNFSVYIIGDAFLLWGNRKTRMTTANWSRLSAYGGRRYKVIIVLFVAKGCISLNYCTFQPHPRLMGIVTDSMAYIKHSHDKDMEA